MERKTVLVSPGEWIIMEKLWAKAPQTIMQLFHSLEEDPGWSKSTVNTMLRRMVAKKLLYYKEGERAKQYYPKVKRDAAALVETESLIDRVYNGSVSMMMNTLIRNKNISKEDIRELYQILGKAVEKDD